MDKHIQMMLMAYFKENKNTYSLSFLVKIYGITFERLTIIIEQLIREKCLEYNENNMLSLTPKGRLMLLNTSYDYYSAYDSQLPIGIIDPQKAWPIDKPYIPDKFTSKL